MQNLLNFRGLVAGKRCYVNTERLWNGQIVGLKM
jgi:hypothetical protein